MEEKTDLISTLERLFELQVFDSFITSLRYPSYKNFTFDTDISFDFPLTLLVGKNGSGKSSVLHSLYGAPKLLSISDFWFSTNLDPIEEFGDTDKDKKHSFIYEYQDGNTSETVLYHRIFHKGRNDYDYWETSKPLEKYGMDTSEKRGNIIKKDVVYLDFKGELSAFDKYFYFGSLPQSKVKLRQSTLKKKKAAKKDYLRNQSKKLKNAIDNRKVYKLKNQEQNELVVDLTKEEINAISFILQEKYTSGKVIKHKFFYDWGTSVILNTDELTYSEAHAGSGEISVVKLVYEVLRAKEKSLILLDEPEVSIHPGAQKKLMSFLLEQIKRKRHQVVIATHSPAFTEGLPRRAIKRFMRNPETKKIDIINECFPSEAFRFLGLPSTYNNATITVEDELAEKILKIILEKEDKFEDINVIFCPGGESYIKKNLITYYSQDVNKNNFVILDGDQQPDEEIIDLNSVSIGNRNEDFYSNQIKEFTNIDIFFTKDGGSGEDRSDQIVEAQEKYISFYKSNVRYFPLQIPEDIIWDECFIKSLIGEEKHINVSNAESNKEKIYKACENHIGKTDSNSMDTMENILINNWIEKKDSNYNIIYAILDEFLGMINKDVLKDGRENVETSSN
ncbi:ATP-dependent nuclease [Salibacterium lacus]|uniref:ATP-dependent endonuclease n=1 Tax=Salibacterium lacus TaxID=1898109 RepID=A0ABW5T519_9BACI